MCAGKVRSGFTPHLRAQVFAQLPPLETDALPVREPADERSGHWGEGITADEMKPLRWVKPTQVVEVSFAEWTRDGSLRHAAFLALRDDKARATSMRDASSA